MEDEQIREFGAISNEVTESLRRHAYIDTEHARHVFQYLILPSFTPPIAWDVFRRRRRDHPEDYVLIRSFWRSDLDLEKMRSPIERLRHPYPLKPTIEVHQLSVPSAELQHLAQDLAAVRLPIGAPPLVGGVDGVTFEVAIEQPDHYIPLSPKCRLTWWCEPPEEWAPLREWVYRAQAIFENAWKDCANIESLPVSLRAIDDRAARHKAQQLFHAGHYGHAAELLADVATREQLTASEKKMLELARRRINDASGK